MEKKVIKTFIAMGIFLILVGTVSAFAVSTMYWEENPLILSPGDSVEITLVLQNLAGDSDIFAEGAILEGEEFIKFLDENIVYEVSLGTKVSVLMSVTVPKDAVIGETHNLKVSFITSEGTSQALGFRGSVEREIPLVIIAKDKSAQEGNNFWILYLVLAVLVVGILTWVFVAKRKKKQKK